MVTSGSMVLERLISTPATHHAHHADSNDDGIALQGNLATCFLYGMLSSYGIITRKYPAAYAIKI